MIFKQQISEEIWNQKYRYNKESVEDTYRRIANTLYTDEDKKLAFDFLSSHKFSFAGRIMYGVGTGRQNVTYSNCYVLPIETDSMESILDTAKKAALTMKAGGGVGYNFSILRPKGAKILSTGEASSGVTSFMSIFDTVCSTIMAGGNRRGAMIGVLDIWHPDILEFIKAKRTGGYSNYNLSVGVYDEFMEAVNGDKKWELRFPDYEKAPDIYKRYWDGNLKKWIDEGYPVKIYKEISARELYDTIIKSNWEYAEPGFLFVDTINEGNPSNYTEFINATNPCGEVPLPPYGSCNLGAVNLAEMVINPFTPEATLDIEGISKATELLVKGLDTVLDINFYPLEEQSAEVEDKRFIGVGITGLADCLAFLCTPYNSAEARQVAELIMKIITNTSYKVSAELARDKGAFPLMDVEVHVEHPFIQQLDTDVQELIREYGLRHSRLISIAPTGTISLVMNNVSSGIEPIFSLQYTRNVKMPDSTTKSQVVKDYAWFKYQEMFGEDTNKPAYMTTVDDLTVESHLLMQSVIQKWVDNSISKTINIPVDYDYESFKKVYWGAWKMGLKGCTTYRPNEIIGSVLTTGTDNKSDSELPEPEEIDVGPVVPGISYEIKGNQGESNWITLNTDDYGNPMQIFINLPKESGMDDTGSFSPKLYFDRLSDTNFIARLISLALRHGIPVEKIIKQADKSSYNMFNLSYKLRNILLDFVNPDKASEDVKKFLVCPECGGNLIKEAGCMKCLDCGYDKCG